MARGYTEIKVKSRSEKSVNREGDQDMAQVEAEVRASQAGAEIEKRHADAGSGTDARSGKGETEYAKAEKKSLASDVKDKIAGAKEKLF